MQVLHPPYCVRSETMQIGIRTDARKRGVAARGSCCVCELEAKMEQDFLSVALSHETEARKKKSQSEEEWVEAEIGRLLHHAEVDDEDEARSSPTSELQVGFALSGYV